MWPFEIRGPKLTDVPEETAHIEPTEAWPRPARQPREFDIPDEHVEQLLIWMDDYHNGHRYVSSYRIWRKIEELFPATSEAGTAWQPVLWGGTKLKIIEKVEE
jgi:hypothetical protein